jgi:hypothetical protein
MASRIKIKLGDAEFEAEGSEESIQAQYSQFLEALQRTAPKASTATNSLKSDQNGAAPVGNVDESLLARLFDLRADGIVALRVLPKGADKEADALLLILYGYRRVKNEEQVLATQLLRAAEQSGVSIYRPAHALAAYDQYVIRGGQRKGSSYSLNNQGILKAEEVAIKIFE